MLVVDALEPVIDWHERGLLPVSVSSTSDARCALVHGDFFAMVRGDGFDRELPGRRFDAVVVDIDHSPRHLLHRDHGSFYEASGLQRLALLLKPDGVFTLWSNDPPDDAFLLVLNRVFAGVRAEVVSFPNPLQDREATNTVYVAGAVVDAQHGR